MRHLGDITKISGYDIEPVWFIMGGSPCQDLSVAGKRDGLAGSRSGLFMEQIRVIKEMREADVLRGRTGEFIRCRYAGWENVPGSFSSNKGRDFQAVLTEFIRVACPGAPAVPLPDKGTWRKWGGYMGYGPHGRWSVAYRTHDAQFWGVPQRRRRISVLADYGGWTAHRILFDPQYRREAEDSDFEQIIADFGNRPRPEIQAFLESMSRYSQSGSAARKRASAAAESGAGSAGEDGLVTRSSFCLQGNGIDRADTAGCNGKGWTEDVSYTLNTIDRPAVYPVAETYDVRISSEGTLNQRAHCYRTDISRCLDTGGEDPGSNHGGGWRS